MNKQRADAKALFDDDAEDDKRPRKESNILDEYVFEEKVQETTTIAKKEPKYMSDLLKRSRERQVSEEIVHKRKLDEKLATQTETNYISESYKQELTQRKHIRIQHEKVDSMHTENKASEKIVENIALDEGPVDTLEVDEIELAKQVKEAKERYFQRKANKA